MVISEMGAASVAFEAVFGFFLVAIAAFAVIVIVWAFRRPR